jgi:hypothetical protein
MDGPLSRPFPFSTSPFQLVLEECAYLQRLRSFPSAMTKRWQKFHGTKLAQSGTEAELIATQFVLVEAIPDVTTSPKELFRIGTCGHQSTDGAKWPKKGRDWCGGIEEAGADLLL